MGAHSYRRRSFALALGLETLVNIPLPLIRMWYTSGTIPPVYRRVYLHRMKRQWDRTIDISLKIKFISHKKRTLPLVDVMILLSSKKKTKNLTDKRDIPPLRVQYYPRAPLWNILLQLPKYAFRLRNCQAHHCYKRSNEQTTRLVVRTWPSGSRTTSGLSKAQKQQQQQWARHDRHMVSTIFSHLSFTQWSNSRLYAGWSAVALRLPGANTCPRKRM